MTIMHLSPLDYQEEEEAPDNTSVDENGNRFVHFSVSGRYITYLARSFWLEGSIERAISLLTNGYDLDEATALDILTGKKTLRGWNDVVIDSDDADMPSVSEVFASLKKQHHETIVDLYTVIKNGREDEEDDDDDEDITIEEAHRRMARVSEKLFTFPDTSNLRSMTEELVGGMDIDDEEKERILRITDGQMDLLEGKEVSGEESPLTFDTGWLRRDGRFYGCKPAQHIALAQKLASADSKNAELELENQGWMKVSAGRWHSVKKPTKKQRDIIFDWCMIHGLTMSWNGRSISYQDWIEEVS